jgi:hypothetical protein
MKILFNVLWNQWQDVTVFYHDGDVFLIQGRKHKYTHRKRFRICKVNATFWRSTSVNSTITLEHLQLS